MFSKLEDSIYLSNQDCVEGLKHIQDKSIQLVCIDPPYNIGKDSWDIIDNYIEWLSNIIKILETKLKDNGSFFVFHNDMEQIAELMIAIKKKTRLQFRQMIVWNKRFDGSKKKGYMDGYVMKNETHNWNKMAEYILFYTFDNHCKLKIRREERKIPQIDISKQIPSRTGGLTGWYSNLETGKNLPTKTTIIPITQLLDITYDDIVPKFNNQKTHHSVWNYDIANRNPIHITPKPIELLKNIILHTTDEGDEVLDCFAGSGSIGVACFQTNRKCFMIEKENRFTEYVKTNWNSVLKNVF
jgi:site-specific DNA-methyltransferase (adenine-specific)